MSELIDKYFAGEMTCEEKKDLFDRIESDEALKKEFLRMQNVVALTQILSRQDDSETSRKGKQHFMQLLFRKRLKRAITVSLKYAAVFAVLVVGTFYTAKLYLSEEFGKSYTIVTAPKGQRVKIELPDGTIAWLSPCWTVLPILMWQRIPRSHLLFRLKVTVSEYLELNSIYRLIKIVKSLRPILWKVAYISMIRRI